MCRYRLDLPCPYKQAGPAAGLECFGGAGSSAVPDQSASGRELAAEQARASLRDQRSQNVRGVDSEAGARNARRFTMVAVVPMFDPPRIDTKETIERCIEKGIMVKMVTGDQLLIGKETAKQLGMGQKFYTTEELMAVHPRPGAG